MGDTHLVYSTKSPEERPTGIRLDTSSACNFPIPASLEAFATGYYHQALYRLKLPRADHGMVHDHKARRPLPTRQLCAKWFDDKHPVQDDQALRRQRAIHGTYEEAAQLLDKVRLR